MSQREIVTVTINPCIDKNASVDHVVPEHKLRCSAPKREPGGGGINVARAVAKLGGEARALWSRGEPIGTLLADLLDAEGVEHEGIEIDEPTRENLIVTETSTGRQFRFGMPGGELSEAEAQRWLDVISGLERAPAYLVLSGSLPPGAPDDFYSQLANRSHDDTRVLVDTSGSALRVAIESGGVDIIKPNLRELRQLCGEGIASDADIVAAARELIERGGLTLVFVSLGGGGAVAVSREEHSLIRAPTVEIRSKVGAGDSTVAGLVLALARGWSLDDASRYGVAAGAAAVMTPGTELCRGEDADWLYRQLQPVAA